MSHRHWFVVLTTDSVEGRSGPYASRKSAKRKANELHKHAPAGEVTLVCDLDAPAHSGRYWRTGARRRDSLDRDSRRLP
jgi:hypothetical protein